MSFNGSGLFQINTPGQPVVAETLIESVVFNEFTEDVATGLSTCIAKDGQTTVTNNIPMSGMRFTGLGDGAGVAESVRVSQVQNSALTYLDTVAGTNTITSAFDGGVTPAALVAGQKFTFIAANTNTGATTLAAGALTAKNVFSGGAALVGGEIVAGAQINVFYDGTQYNIESGSFIAAGTGAVRRSPQGKSRDFVSVLDFAANGTSGAAVDPTGVVDSAAGFQAAIDAVAARGSGDITRGGIIIPDGTYLIGTQLELNQQSVYVMGTGNPIIKWNGNSSTAMFRVRDSSHCLWDGITFLGKTASPPTAAIYLEEASSTTVGTNEFMVVRNCYFGRRYGQESSPAWNMLRGIWIGGASNTNNDTFFVEQCAFWDCTTAGVAIDNAQSIWGSFKDCLFDSCGYGLYTGSNTTGYNLNFNRNTVADLHAFRDITVSIYGFNSEHSVLPISQAQAASIYIDGGKISVNAECVGANWATFVTGNYLSLRNLQVIENGVSGKLLSFTGSSANECNVNIRQCELPGGDTIAGYVFSSTTATLGTYIDIEQAQYSRKVFFGYGSTYDAVNLADGAGVTALSATAAALDVTAGDLFLISFSLDLQGILLTGGTYQDDGLYGRFQNETTGTIDLASGTLRFRRLRDTAIKARTSAAYNVGLLASGAGATTTLAVPGALLGDFAVWSQTCSYANHCVTAYVSATDVVSLRVQNEDTGNLDPGSGTLTLAILRASTANRTGAVVYDPASLADGAGVTTTIPVPGARLGDFVVVSFSLDLQSILLTGYVSSANVVSARFQNETGGTIDLASGNLSALVFTQ